VLCHLRPHYVSRRNKISLLYQCCNASATSAVSLCKHAMQLWCAGLGIEFLAKRDGIPFFPYFLNLSKCRRLTPTEGNASYYDDSSTSSSNPLSNAFNTLLCRIPSESKTSPKLSVVLPSAVDKSDFPPFADRVYLRDNNSGGSWIGFGINLEDIVIFCVSI